MSPSKANYIINLLLIEVGAAVIGIILRWQRIVDRCFAPVAQLDRATAF